MSVASDIKRPFRSGNVLIQLIIVNIAVFLLLNIFRIFYFFQGYTGIQLEYIFHYKVLSWVAMPSRFEEFIHAPWTILTYMFSQVAVGHIFFNLLVMYFFGGIIQNMIGFSRTLSIYIYGGLIGGLLTLLFHSTIPVLYQNAAPLIGASGAVMAIVIAAVTLAPDSRVFLFFFGEVRLIYIGLVYVVIDLVSISYVDGIGHICHLGGALTGFLYIKSLQNGRDLSRGFNTVFYSIRNIFKPKKSKPKMKVVKNSGSARSAQPQSGQGASKSQVQARIDTILDKISKGGYESLSKEEKDYLFRHGKDI